MRLLLFVWLLSGPLFAQPAYKEIELKRTVSGGLPAKIKAKPLSLVPKTGLPTNVKQRLMAPFAGRASFTLPAPARVSAGVFSKSGVLIRTLFPPTDYPAGTHTFGWNGRDDLVSLVASGKYDIKAMSNNVTYTWEGKIGNTSKYLTGPTVHRQLDAPGALAFADGHVYYVTRYAEGQKWLNRFHPDSIGVNIASTLLQGNNRFYAMVSDGVRNYLAQSDPFAQPANTKHFIFAFNVADNTQHTFSSGVSTSNRLSPTFSSVIDLETSTSGKCYALAVQRNGNLLFAAHTGLNQIRVFHKLTGALLQTIAFTGPKQLALEGDEDLWVVSGTNTVQKFPVNSDGTLGTGGVTLSGLTEPLAIAVSPDSSAVVLCDGGSSQQVKGFSTTTGGSASWTVGQAGGYSTNAAAANDKFFFSNVNGETERNYSAITFQSDGSFWFVDTYNDRMMHYSSAHTYVNQVMYMSRPFNVSVDPANPNRVFQGNMEFQIDYTKNLGPTNGSWSLVANWGTVPNSNYSVNTRGIGNVTTFPNGRRYCRIRNSTVTDSGYEIMELMPNGVLRSTGVTFTKHSQITAEGHIQRITQASGVQRWMRRALTGFDGSNNPTYAAEAAVEQVNYTAADPSWGGAYYVPATITSTGQYISFNGSGAATDTYHIGAVKNGAWLWRSAYTTHPNYSGPFPKADRFDVGNSMGVDHPYAGSIAVATGRNIVWHYNGEFWDAGQTNKFQHLWDNGLPLGQFGVTDDEVGGGDNAPPQFSGNGFSWVLVPVNDDSVYIYQGDGHAHAGVHRWLIAGLKTIREQVVIPVTVQPNYPLTYRKTLPGIDLLSGLPFDTTVPNGTSNLTRSREDVKNNVNSDWWEVKTNRTTYFEQDRSNDLWVWRRNSTGADTVRLSIPISSPVTNWTLVATIDWNGNNGNATTGGAFFEVFDNTVKKIVSHWWQVVESGARPLTMYANSAVMYSGFRNSTDGIYAPILSKAQPLIISRSGTQITVKYAHYDAVTVNVADVGADVSRPASVQVRMNGPSQARRIDISELRFISN